MATYSRSGVLTPTRSGWALIALVAVLVPASIVFSYPELWVATFTLVVALAVSVLVVMRSGSLTLQRVAPTAVTNGDAVEQMVLVVNGGRFSGLVSLRDRIAEPMHPAGERTDPVRLSPLGAGERRRLRTVVPTTGAVCFASAPPSWPSRTRSGCSSGRSPRRPRPACWCARASTG